MTASLQRARYSQANDMQLILLQAQVSQSIT